jgi:hypothetical protein
MSRPTHCLPIYVPLATDDLLCADPQEVPLKLVHAMEITWRNCEQGEVENSLRNEDGFVKSPVTGRVDVLPIAMTSFPAILSSRVWKSTLLSCQLHGKYRVDDRHYR